LHSRSRGEILEKRKKKKKKTDLFFFFSSSSFFSLHVLQKTFKTKLFSVWQKFEKKKPKKKKKNYSQNRTKELFNITRAICIAT